MGFFIQKVIIGLVIVLILFVLWKSLKTDNSKKKDTEDKWNDF